MQTSKTLVSSAGALLSSGAMKVHPSSMSCCWSVAVANLRSWNRNHKGEYQVSAASLTRGDCTARWCVTIKVTDSNVGRSGCRAWQSWTSAVRDNTVCGGTFAEMRDTCKRSCALGFACALAGSPCGKTVKTRRQLALLWSHGALSPQFSTKSHHVIKSTRCLCLVLYLK